MSLCCSGGRVCVRPTGGNGAVCAPGSAGPCPQLCSADKDGCWDQTGDAQKPAAAFQQAAGVQLTAAGAHSSQGGAPPRKARSHHREQALLASLVQLRRVAGCGTLRALTFPGRSGDKSPSGHPMRARPAEHQPDSSRRAHSVHRFPASTGLPGERASWPFERIGEVVPDRLQAQGKGSRAGVSCAPGKAAEISPFCL